jgi:hypothetical protein
LLEESCDEDTTRRTKTSCSSVSRQLRGDFQGNTAVKISQKTLDTDKLSIETIRACGYFIVTQPNHQPNLLRSFHQFSIITLGSIKSPNHFSMKTESNETNFFSSSWNFVFFRSLDFYFLEKVVDKSIAREDV